MASNELDIPINRPIQEVLAYVSDPQHATEWQSGLVEIMAVSSGPLAVGTQFTAVRNFMGHRMEPVIQLTNFNQNRVFACKSIPGASPFKQSFPFETTAGGTKITTALEMETTGFLGLAKSLIASGLKRDLSADLVELRQLNNINIHYGYTQKSIKTNMENSP